MIRVKITQKVDGTERAWFRSSLGRRVGTSMRATTPGAMNWTNARQMMALAQYGIDLMLERTAKGIGSDDAPMPPLKQSPPRKRWSISQKKMVEYGAPEHVGYPGFKRRLGLNPIRDLRGPGGKVVTETSFDRWRKNGGKLQYLRSGTKITRGLDANHKGHMVDDIRVNYVDDNRATIDISTVASRTKARANEAKAPWWGWSPSDVRKLMDYAGEMFNMSIADKVASYGLIGIGKFADSTSWARRVAQKARRTA